MQTAAASRAISFFVKGCGFEPVPFSSSASSASAPSVDAAEAAGAPAVVLCGDFNCLPELPFDPDRGQHMVGAGGEGDEDEEEGEGSGARRAGALGVAEEEGEGAGDWARGPADDAEAALMSIPAPSPTSSTSLPPTPPASSYGSELSAPFVLLHSGALPADHPEHPDRWCAGLRVRDAPSSAGPKFRSLQDGNGPRDASHSPYPNPRLGPLTVDAPLHNVYLMPAFSRAAPLFTTKTDDFQGWIDHIFASAGVQVQKGSRAGRVDQQASLRLTRPFPLTLSSSSTTSLSLPFSAHSAAAAHHEGRPRSRPQGPRPRPHAQQGLPLGPPSCRGRVPPAPCPASAAAVRAIMGRRERCC